MAIKFVLDTSGYSMFERGDARLRKWISHTNEIVVPLVVIGELRAGFAAGTKQLQNEKLLRSFLDLPNVTTVSIDHPTTETYAQIFAQLHRAGRPIGTNDIWIASIAIQLGLPLLTLDADYTHVPDLTLIELSAS